MINLPSANHRLVGHINLIWLNLLPISRQAVNQLPAFRLARVLSMLSCLSMDQR